MPTDCFDDIRDLIVSARNAVARGVNAVQANSSLEIGRRMVEQEQRGSKEVLQKLAEHLGAEFDGGFSKGNLEDTRRVALHFRSPSHISQAASWAQLARKGQLQLSTKCRQVVHRMWTTEAYSPGEYLSNFVPDLMRTKSAYCPMATAAQPIPVLDHQKSEGQAAFLRLKARHGMYIGGELTRVVQAMPAGRGPGGRNA